MRLLTADEHGTFSLLQFRNDQLPQYAILSHTWGLDSDEVMLDDIRKGDYSKKVGYKKIQFCCKQAASDGIRYFWMDTCCIDRSSSAELTQAVNSMFDWYRKAVKCYVYLSDVSTLTAHRLSLPVSWQVAFRKSRWFSRGWTLQELVAPPCVEFYSAECDYLGSRSSLETTIHEVTNIAVEAIRGVPLANFGIAERLAWTENRQTRLQEDKAYCLLGIFNVYMPLLYGEGAEKAKARLHKEINKAASISRTKPRQARVLATSNIPFRRNADFVNRKDSLSQTSLEQIEERATTTPIVFLVGSGGVGKSELVVEYCYRLRERSSDRWIFWIHAGTFERIEQGYYGIAEQANIAYQKGPGTDIFDLVTRWLLDTTNGKWTLVLDDLDYSELLTTSLTIASEASDTKQAEWFQRFLSAFPRQAGNGSILITTRAIITTNELVRPQDIIIVDHMTLTDADELLRKKLTGVAEAPALGDLASVLEYVPLAIVQAAAHIRQSVNLGVQGYIDEFRDDEEQVDFHGFAGDQSQRDQDAVWPILRSWQMSFADVRKNWPTAANLLSLMSCFDPQGIPMEVLKYSLNRTSTWYESRQYGALDDMTRDQGHGIDGKPEIADNDVYDTAVAKLQSYSLLLIRSDEQTLEIHSSAQAAMRKWLKGNSGEDRWRAHFSQILNAILPVGNLEGWSLYEKLYPHSKLIEKQQPKESHVILEWAQILRKMAWYAWATGNYSEAARMCKLSAMELTKSVGSEHLESLYSLGLLATIYTSQGRWSEAETLELQVVATSRSLLGEEHPDTLSSIANLALTYSNQGRWAEAEELQAEVLRIREKLLGPEHPDTLSNLHNLALSYQNQGQWGNAEKAFMQVMNTSWRVLSPDHPSTLASMTNLASVYRAQGRWKEAHQLQAQAVETSLKTLGPENVFTLSSMANLASTLWSQGRWSEAETLELQVVATSRSLLGEEHPDTLSSIANLALTYSNQGRWAEAEALLVPTMETRKRKLGSHHPDTLNSMHNLAATYRSQGRFGEAEQLETYVVEARKTRLGVDHPDTLTSMSNLASTYSDQGQWAKAEQLQVQVLEVQKSKLGADHPNTLTGMGNLATTYMRQGRWVEAEQLQVQVLEISKTRLGVDHPDTLTSMSNLASTYSDQGQWAKAEQLQVQVLEVRKMKLGADHPDTLTSMHNLACTWKTLTKQCTDDEL